MSDQGSSPPPPGWYPDPNTPGGQRWWDGSQWTDHTDRNYPQPAQGVAGQAPQASGQKVDTWLWQSIVATILCCLPFGIVGIVFAARANSEMGVGNWAGAAENARKARMWTLWAVGVGLTVIVLYFIFVVAVGLSVETL